MIPLSYLSHFKALKGYRRSSQPRQQTSAITNPAIKSHLISAVTLVCNALSEVCVCVCSVDSVVLGDFNTVAKHLYTNATQQQYIFDPYKWI